jgi:hypothetical protein
VPVVAPAVVAGPCCAWVVIAPPGAAATCDAAGGWLESAPGMPPAVAVVEPGAPPSVETWPCSLVSARWSAG